MGSIGNTTKGGIVINRGERHISIFYEDDTNDDCILIMRDDLKDFVKQFNNLLWEDFGTQLKLREIKDV